MALFKQARCKANHGNVWVLDGGGGAAGGGGGGLAREGVCEFVVGSLSMLPMRQATHTQQPMPEQKPARIFRLSQGHARDKKIASGIRHAESQGSPEQPSLHLLPGSERYRRRGGPGGI